MMRALRAMGTAMWDLNAHSTGLPLDRFPGAVALGSLATCAGGAYDAESETVDYVVQEMAGFVARGFSTVKMNTPSV